MREKPDLVSSYSTFTGKINRKDWGLNWNALLETGGVAVNDEVRISCELQLER